MKYALIVFALASSLFAQTENTAPVVWEPYRHSDLGVSVNLPKMPIVVSNYDTCKEELKRSSYAYAEGAVYEFTVVAGGIRQGVRPRTCSSEKTPFDQSTIDQRLQQLRQEKGAVETKMRIADLDAFRFSEERSVRIVVPDIVHKRWVELAVVFYPKGIPDTDRLTASLQFDANAGKEIADGATQTLGDPSPAPTDNKTASTPEKATAESKQPNAPAGTGAAAAKDPQATPLLIVAKPQARYTEAARNANVQGSVRLKVTLLPNGAVGTVTPITELTHGMTEQAIAAARKLVFLPARINDVPVSKVVTIDYSFSIY
jgi:TonB family protein